MLDKPCILYFYPTRFFINSIKQGHLPILCNIVYYILHDGTLPVTAKSKHYMHIKIYSGSYMSFHVLLNLLNELRKRDKMRGLLSTLSLFRNKLNEFNNTGSRMLASIYHITLKLLKNSSLA